MASENQSHGKGHCENEQRAEQTHLQEISHRQRILFSFRFSGIVRLSRENAVGSALYGILGFFRNFVRFTGQFRLLIHRRKAQRIACRI